MANKALYIHIPFCQTICTYCDFCKVYYNNEMANQYLLALKQELDSLSIQEPLQSIYIGGGTPSSLELEQLQSVMSFLQPYITKETKEFCIEVNPESMNKAKLLILKNGGINRLSIGVQTFQEHLAINIDRKHTNRQVFSLIHEAKEMGINNLSIDMMYGLPNQTIEDIKKDISMIKRLPIQHISYYSLILEEHTILKHQKYQQIEETLEQEMYQCIDDALEEMGFHQYEVSNYTREGFSSKHNKVYWHYQDYYGVGLGATGKIHNQMLQNTRNIKTYLKGDYCSSIEKISSEDSLFNHIMMSLRLLEGLDIEQMNKTYQIDFMERFKHPMKKYLNNGMLEITDGRLHCTKQSIRYLNAILIDFME